MYKKNIICSFGSKIFTNFKMAACPSFIKMKRPSFVSQKMKLKKDMLPFWYLWIFLSQNFSLCSPCMYLLTLKRIKQFFNLFVSKKPLKNVSFVWKIGLGRFVFSTTVGAPMWRPYYCSQIAKQKPNDAKCFWRPATAQTAQWAGRFLKSKPVWR